MSQSSPEPAEISQRDLRHRSAEIMDGLEAGERYAVTRNGHHIGDLVPAARRRVFVSRTEFAAVSARMPVLDADAFRADLDRFTDAEADDPYARANRSESAPTSPGDEA